MRLQEAIKRVDKSKEAYIDLEEIAYSIGIQEYQFNEDNRLKRYWLANHTCTDKVVGFSLLFLDGSCIGYSQQLARKSEIEYNWFSEPDYMAIREYIMSILKTDYYNPNHELDSDIRDIEYFRYVDEKIAPLNIVK